MSGYKDDGDLNASLGHFPLEVEAAQSRQPHIQDHAAWQIQRFALEKLLPRCKGFDAVTYSRDEPLYGCAHRWVVIYHENEMIGSLH
jgi:hypothetical protein